TLRRTVDITVVIPSVTIPESIGLTGDEPPRHTNPHNFPVLYLLHGYGNNHATWTGYTNVELYAEERNIAVVMLSAENKFYIDHGNNDLFYEFIENELPDFITGMFPISQRPEDTFIAGLSMGGYGTLVHALGNPEKYRAFGSFSGAVKVNPNSPFSGETGEIDPKNDPLDLAKRLSASGKPFPEMYIACGDQDMVIEANRTFVAELRAMGQTPTWDEVPGYGHEWRFWNLQVERFLDWIPRTDFYADGGRRQV
ncbi:MAG: alpha/beta hydrolase family protein, partial [Oscillospiraceae bacterium]